MRKIDFSFTSLKRFFQKLGLHPFVFLIPALLGFLGAFFEGMSFGLLIPTIKGVIEGDPSFVRNLPLFKDILRWFPHALEGKNSTVFAFLFGLILVSVLAKNFFRYLSAITVSRQLNQFANTLRKFIYGRYLGFGKLFFDQHNVGHLHQILTGHTAVIASHLNVFNQSLYAFFTLAAYLVIMATISWPLTLMIVALFPFFHWAVGWLIRKIAQTSEMHTISTADLARNISNALTCIPLVKAYTNEEREKEWFAHASNQLERFQFNMDKKMLLIAPIQEVILFSTVLLLAGLTSFFWVYEKKGEIAGYLVFFVLLKRSFSTFGAVNYIQASLASIQGPILEIMKILDTGKEYIVPNGTKRFTGLKKEITFNRLNFSYLKGIQTLRDVTFSVEKGKTTALVGPSGAGKTTLISLIMRFYDTPPGTLFLDGVDIREFTSSSLHSKIALVSQETQLFNASFRMNLKYGLNGQVAEREMETAVMKARLSDLIASLPDGLDTEIGDRGVKLSGGEKQRLSLARAILKEAEIIILDEATSALDSMTERLIQEAIDNALQGRTAVVIAHRLSTIKYADKVVVIEKGRIVEEGRLDELLIKKGHFYQYWEAQRFF